MALIAERPRIRRTGIDWSRLAKTTVERTDKFDVISEVGAKTAPAQRREYADDTRRLNDQNVAMWSAELPATSLWRTVSTLRLLNNVEVAEDYLIARVAQWVQQQSYEALRHVFGLAAWDCTQLIGAPYDDLADEKISTYVVTLGLTRSVRGNLSASWRELYDRAYEVVRRSEGDEIATRILGRPD